jgi:DNA-directed RNA polymerase subunit beta'
MQIKIFNVDEFSKTLPEVTHPEELLRGDFHPEGLFSKQIFGPEVTATCSCNTYWGRANIGRKCPVCNVDIIHSNVRRTRFAKITLPFKIINPIMYYIISKVGKTTIKNILDDFLFSDNVVGYYFNKKFVAIKVADKQDPEFKIPEGSVTYCGLNGAFDIVKDLCERFSENPDWQFIKNNLDNFYINNIIVNPPDYRPASKSKDDKKVDELNKYYKQILNFCSIKKQDFLDEVSANQINEHMIKYLHRHVFSLYEYILESFSKKKGIIRKFILGKRIDFSGRTVITPDPTLNLDQCSIPYLVALELYKLDIAILLMSKRLFNRFDLALNEIEECIKLEDLKYFDLVSEWIANKYVILNRQPTLHRLGILAFKVKLNKNYVIKIHPFICEPYNADFDGDQMAVYRPLYEATEKECEEKLSIANNLLSPSTGNMSIGINQDIIFGLYILTSPDEKKKVTHNNIETYEGRVIFNSIMPKNYPFINKIIDKKTLKTVLNDVIKTHDKQVCIKLIDKIKMLGFEVTTNYGCTMSLKNMDTTETKQIVKDLIDDPSKTWIQKLNELKSDVVMDKVKRIFPYSKFIESGSRGSWDQATQLILCRGYVSNSKGKIITEPIRNNLIDGLTKKEFFNSCYGSRKALLDVAINTGVSGYLTRKLVYCSSSLEMDPSIDDCGTSDALLLVIPDKEIDGIKPLKLAKSLVGRFIQVEGQTELTKITYENYDQFVGKTIKLRSPIFCKNHNMCKKCYGDTSDMIHSNYVGIIAAEALGEISTQLVLRTFHTCFRKNVEILNVNNERVSFEKLYEKYQNGDSEYTFSCSLDGKIKSSKIISVHKDRKEKQLIRVTLDNNEVYECSLDHLHLLVDGTYIEAKDLKENNILMSDLTIDLITHYKVKKVEIITLDDYEELYDIEVDSEHHNFLLAAGVFVHNSGTAKANKDGSEDNQDIINDLTKVNKLFRCTEKHPYNKLLIELFKIYSEYSDVLLVHYECIIAQMMRKNNDRWRTTEHRDLAEVEMTSIDIIPEKESFLLAVAFCKPKSYLVDSILELNTKDDMYDGILEKIMTNKTLK